MSRYPDIFDRPASPYLPDMPPLARRASAVADLLEAVSCCEVGRPPPNLDEGVGVLLTAIGDRELAAMHAEGRHRQVREWLLFLSVVVQAELKVRTFELQNYG